MSRSKFAPAVLTTMACALLALPAVADSQARIVRLSDVQGSVLMDKNTGMGFERAFLNLPITQGAQLQTRGNGRAEVEFEDGSTMRLGPDTKVEFSTLGLSDSGKRLSVINLVEGIAYVAWTSKTEAFTLNFASEKVALDRPAHFRVETSADVSKFAVFKGDVEVAGPAGKVMVGKHKMAMFDAGADDKYTVAKLEEDPLDSWDREASDYHQQYQARNNNSSPYGYGFSDLGYYGSYQNLPGYGLMWQPYFTGVGWDPFMDGAWSWYPGFGFMYVSAYPWGWLPYRYGNWMFVPGFGWMWQPGYWNSWVNVPRYLGSLPTGFRPLVAPTGTVHTVAVGRGGPVLETTTRTSLIVSKGSAGLGIARGSVSSLGHLNSQVARSGSAHVEATPQFAAIRSGASGSMSASSVSHSGMSGVGHAGSATSGGSHSSSGGSGHR
jgi:hypothetical protein